VSCRELTASAFGLAILGARPQESFLETLREFSSPGLSLEDLVIRAWALALWDALSKRQMDQLLDTLASKYWTSDFTDIVLFFLLHTAMLVSGEGIKYLGLHENLPH
jgi:hypothetical protein